MKEEESYASLGNIVPTTRLSHKSYYHSFEVRENWNDSDIMQDGRKITRVGCITKSSPTLWNTGLENQKGNYKRIENLIKK